MLYQVSTSGRSGSDAEPQFPSRGGGTAVHIDAASYQRVLGDELRRLRKQRGWTRKDLNDRLQSDISLQTLATYELGTRQCSVVRTGRAVPRAGRAAARTAGARARPGVQPVRRAARLRVDLRQVVRDTQPELRPLRRWANGRLQQTRRQRAESP